MKQSDIGESYPSKVGAVFQNVDQTQAALQTLVNQAGLAHGQISLVEPNDAAVDQKVEPETRGIARVLARSHIAFGAAGLLVGLLCALILVFSGLKAVESSPFVTLAVLGFFGAIVGLLLGGLVSLRPDHERLILTAKKAAEDGNWALIVHARDHRQSKVASDVLSNYSGKIVETW
jgi:hypothetical protein